MIGSRTPTGPGLGILLSLAMVLPSACGKESASPPVGGQPVKLSSRDAASVPPAVLRADAGVSTGRGRARPEKNKRYRAALRRGRKAARAGDYAAALAGFEYALLAAPGDARALSELGWVAFKHGELERADRATDASIAAAVTPKLVAASLYNRGRIAEERGDNQRAIEAYQRSLELRDNETVKKRLAMLGGAVRRALAPVALDGPYRSLAAACASLAFFEPGWTCDAPIAAGPNRLNERNPPYLELRIIGENPAAAKNGESFDSCRLALRTSRGWYLGTRVTCEQYAWAKTSIESLRWIGRDQATASSVEWTVKHALGDRGYDRDGARYETWVTFRWRFYCGIGASGVPSCTPALPLSVSEQGNYKYSDVEPYELEASLSKSGSLSVSSKSSTVDAAARVFLGQRRLVFP